MTSAVWRGRIYMLLVLGELLPACRLSTTQQACGRHDAGVESVSLQDAARIVNWLVGGFAADEANANGGASRVRLILPSGAGTFSVKMVGKTPPEGVTDTSNYIIQLRRQGAEVAVDVLVIGEHLSDSRESWNVTLLDDGGLSAKRVNRFPEYNPLLP
jgi:hypothetical protein